MFFLMIALRRSIRSPAAMHAPGQGGHGLAGPRASLSLAESGAQRYYGPLSHVPPSPEA
jgi:hypothetical protein